MKELSIEEKVKRYDEAIEKFDVILNLNTVKESGTIFADDVRKIFPELAESEDERIRKEIIEYIKTGTYHKSWIAWLEKQAERKTPRWMIDFLDNYRRMIGCSLDYDEARDVDGKILCIKEWLEKQVEQKPNKEHDICDTCDEQASCVDPCCAKLVEKQKPNPVLDIEIPFGTKDSELQEVSYYIPEGFHAEIEGNGVVIKRGEQKPVGFNIGDEITVNGQVCRVVAVDKDAWSEEDESTRHLIVNAIWIYYSDCVDDKSERDRLLNWFNSLKDRVQPQSKQEWSEEDRKYLNIVYSAVLSPSSEGIFDYHQVEKKDVKKWLDKHLKSQNTWKPSEQDVLLLERIFDGKSDPKDFQASLQNIIEQLKKLREGLLWDL